MKTEFPELAGFNFFLSNVLLDALFKANDSLSVCNNTHSGVIVLRCLCYIVSFSFMFVAFATTQTAADRSPLHSLASN